MFLKKLNLKMSNGIFAYGIFELFLS